MQQNNIEFEVRVNGRSISEYKHEGKTFVEGRPRSEFSLFLKNRTGILKYLLIPSVDGLSVINGKPASSESPGFILYPGESIEIPGWLVNSETAAKFYFSPLKNEKSYAERMGFSGDNNGVIGVRVFSEKQIFPARYEFSDSSPRGIVASAAAPEPQLGTGWGDQTDFRTKKEEFEKGAHYADLVIFYDTKEGLKARGVDIVESRRRTSSLGATPFPGDYCMPPR